MRQAARMRTRIQPSEALVGLGSIASCYLGVSGGLFLILSVIY